MSQSAPNNLQAKNLTRRGRGRPKGVPNKTGVLAKEAIALAAEGLGGTARLIKWAKADAANERVFWGQIYTKLLPLQIGNVDGNALRIIVEKP